MKSFLLHVLGSLLPLVSAQSNGLRVSTQQGDVVGTFVDPSVRRFLGIPYATAARWEAPTSPPKRKNVFNASSFSDSCPQMLTPANVEFNLLAWTFNRTDEVFVPMSEECLTANIWSPGVNRKQKTAVMVWVHGGAFQWGTSRLPIYDATNLVRDHDDVMVVSFNYRLNIFGQPNAPQLDEPGKAQNFLLLDIDAGVQWVHDNIANFGGDPDRIILFGQSAGANGIDAYAFAHPNDTIVKGFIDQSGNLAHYPDTISIFDPEANPRINTTTWNTVATAVGCGDAPTTTQFSCMKNISSSVLQNAVTKNNVPFNLVQDEITYFHDNPARIAAGQFLKVPMMMGTTKNEDDVFIVAQELVEVGHVIPILSEMMSDIVTTVSWVCTLGTTTLARFKAGVRLFRYQYEAIFPNLSLRPELRAFHGSELPLIFGTYNQSPIAPTPTEIAFSKFMQSAWVGFARDPKQGLIDLGWPAYDPNTVSVAQLGNLANQTGAVFTNVGILQELCSNTSVLLDALAGLMSFPGGT